MGLRRPPREGRRLIACVVLGALAWQLLLDVEWPDGEAFAASAGGTLPRPLSSLVAQDFASGASSGAASEAGVRLAGSRAGRRAIPAAAGAAATGASVAQKVINAMGAGAVASVIQAALSAIGEPIVNRVLVKRMTTLQAIKEVKPKMMLDYFKTTLTTNFLKFPFFEAINTFCALLPIDPSVRGFVTGAVFTTATLPVTNYRYRKSMQLEVNWANIYEAYWPTVIRDVVYGIVRNWSTIAVLGLNPRWKATTPEVLFIVVILGCLGSAPFNEWRGYLLQSKGQELTFREFFRPQHFVRSTSLGALKQGLALAVGYWCAPPAQKFVRELLASFRP